MLLKGPQTAIVMCKYSKIFLIRHLKGLEKTDELGQVTNYANRWKLYHRTWYTIS